MVVQMNARLVFSNSKGKMALLFVESATTDAPPAPRPSQTNASIASLDSSFTLVTASEIAPRALQTRENSASKESERVKNGWK